MKQPMLSGTRNSPALLVPACTVTEQCRIGARRHLSSDFRQMQVHHFFDGRTRLAGDHLPAEGLRPRYDLIEGWWFLRSAEIGACGPLVLVEAVFSAQRGCRGECFVRNLSDFLRNLLNTDGELPYPRFAGSHSRAGAPV
jgi:hypothetical protein